MAVSIRGIAMSKTTQKPKKPHPDFPLYSHRNGQWAKKIRGKTRFFGQWNDPQAALTEYLRIKDDLQAGRIPTPVAGVVVTLADVVNAYLADADQRKETGDLSPVSFAKETQPLRIEQGCVSLADDVKRRGMDSNPR